MSNCERERGSAQIKKQKGWRIPRCGGKERLGSVQEKAAHQFDSCEKPGKEHRRKESD